MDDLPGVPSNSDDMLKKLIEEFLQSKQKEITKQNRESKYNYKTVVVTGSEGGKPVYRHRRNNIDLHQVPVQIEQFPNDEGEEILDFVEDEYGQRPPSRWLKRLYVDAFGVHCNRINDWESRLPDIASKLEADVTGFSKIKLVGVLRGVDFEKGDVEIRDNIKLVRSEKNKVYARGQPQNFGLREFSPLGDGIIEIQATQRKRDETVSEYATELLELVLTTLRLYLGTPIDVNVTYQIPITYSPAATQRSAGRLQTLGDTTTISPFESGYLDILHGLISRSYDERRGKFGQPIEVALDHFETSASSETNNHSGITFSIIGLESLYKHFVDGSGSSNDIQRYAALVLGQTIPDLDSITVKENLEEAYGKRNQLVHGETVPRKKRGQLQQHILDYLRYSIVIFAHIWEMETNFSSLPIEDALIDDKARDRLRSRLDTIHVDNYLNTSD
ncbi:hypothetical protein [Halorubrum sp. FL23]|uniref:hypothetical protein n=1 Tax=Halorubrum sp. FL23 TaxID=3458704 RepID=UPI0040335877